MWHSALWLTSNQSIVIKRLDPTLTQESNETRFLQPPASEDPTHAQKVGSSSSLDAKESTLHTRDYSSFRGFLLSGLGKKPSAVKELFTDLDQRDGSKRLVTWSQCRSSAWFVRNQNSGEVRVASSRCHLRWCPLCGFADKFAIISQVSPRIQSLSSPKFATFTLNHSSRPLPDQVKGLYDSFVRLRRMRRFKRTISGGVWFFQITKNDKTNQWHLHLHTILEGRYYDQAELSRDWKRASKGSYIVDIRAIRDSSKAAAYVARYATDPCDLVKLSRIDRITVFDALHHRKIKGTWGTWQDLKLKAMPPEDAGDWQFMAGYWETYNFRQRDLWLAEIWEAWVHKRECSSVPRLPEDPIYSIPPPVEELHTYKQAFLFRP